MGVKMNSIEKQLLEQIADLHSIPEGSYSIRKNGKSFKINSTEDIQIVPKEDLPGIDIFVKEGVKGKSLHIPAIVTEGGINDLVYNDFYIGKGADILIVAGCGVHNNSDQNSNHDGIHSFHLEEGACVRYVEKHIGSGSGKGEKILNPTTTIVMEKGSHFEMETSQLGGVSYSDRKTKALLKEEAVLVVKEKILTTDFQEAKTIFDVTLKGKNSSVNVISRSVAKEFSRQKFVSVVKGQNECFGHVECDGIVLDNAVVESSPRVIAKNENATLVHEASIGKIAGEQILKLQTLGLSEDEARDEIIKGFLR